MNGIYKDIAYAEKKKQKKLRVCRESCALKVKLWRPKIWFQPSGCGKRMIIRAGACISAGGYSIIIVGYIALRVAALVVLRIAESAVKAILIVIDKIMAAAWEVVSVAAALVKVGLYPVHILSPTHELHLTTSTKIRLRVILKYAWNWHFSACLGCAQRQWGE